MLYCAELALSNKLNKNKKELPLYYVAVLFYRSKSLTTKKYNGNIISKK